MTLAIVPGAGLGPSIATSRELDVLLVFGFELAVTIVALVVGRLGTFPLEPAAAGALALTVGCGLTGADSVLSRPTLDPTLPLYEVAVVVDKVAASAVCRDSATNSPMVIEGLSELVPDALR